MASDSTSKRFVYQTQGVCPPEIHFSLGRDRLTEARFVGGGCPGNALLVARLIKGMPVDEIMGRLDGIDCRNGTSCPDQLQKAIKAAVNGSLKPSESYRIVQDMSGSDTVGFIGGLDGNLTVLPPLLGRLRDADIGTIYCMGNLTGDSPDNSEVIRILRKENILSVRGDRDEQYAGGNGTDRHSVKIKDRDWLVRQPQVLDFQLGGKKAIAFYGRYIQTLPGYSDFDPYALEMNMVCGMTDFMRDESVFPALEAMVPQFKADVVVFGQTDRSAHWHVAHKDFVGIGPASGTNGLSCTVLSNHNGRIETKILNV